MATEQQDTTEKAEPEATEKAEPEATKKAEPEASEKAEPEASEKAEPEATSNAQLTEKPEVTDEHREKAKEMAKAYEDDRPTIGLPGTSNTVSGQAVVEWVDEDGSPKFGDVEDGEGVKREDVMGVREKAMGDDDE